jgi:hypothetical protein
MMSRRPSSRFIRCALAAAAAVLIVIPALGQDEAPPPDLEEGFVPLFDGTSLDGWELVHGSGPGYEARDGLLVCRAGTGGNFFHEETFSDFVLRFDFRLEPGGNNGVAVRAPVTGNPAYAGMEIQILDDYADKYAALQPWQFHGSVYGIFPAKRGALKKAGEWNEEEIACRGTKIRVTLNGTVIVDADLAEVKDEKIIESHPGIRRRSGRIGFMSHGSLVEFRNIRIKDLGLNVPPEGFAPLFNGRDLGGWKGLVESPPKRAKMSPEELAKAQAAADEAMRGHWKVEDGILVFDGKGQSLCTARDYGDFELLVDWKIPPGGDSGIYLRGSPQVQIWDHEVGSGGLYNNQKNPSKPLVKADHPPGEWNRFRILMTGDRVTVHLNGKLVVNDVVMENYWERDKPIYPSGQIELQNHGATLLFRNIFLREIPREGSEEDR